MNSRRSHHQHHQLVPVSASATCTLLGRALFALLFAPTPARPATPTPAPPDPPTAAAAAVPVSAPDFARDIRPILERHCFTCHGPNKQKNGFRLDVRSVALKGGDSGKPAIVPHRASASPLIRYVSGDDPEIIMPPKASTGSRPTMAEIKMLRDWIDAGPAWPDALAGEPANPTQHWSLRPLRQPALPSPPPGSARTKNVAATNPIDAFIRARLTEKHLTPSAEADRRTLIRRVCADLVGLPPTPDEVTAFVNDPDPLAYEKLVDRLLASPRHGERWARHWLDTIHFADSHGYEHDLPRDNAWPFRDYVIQSFNRDTPWPRFVREQLAADVFYPDEPRLTAALGYLGAGTFDMSTYGTAPVTFDYLDRDDLVTQTMAAFVSTTANCARCHAHKFDPISQSDYYALQAVFAGVLKGEVTYDEDVAVARQRRRWKNLLAAAERREAATLLAPENSAAIEQWMKDQGRPATWEMLSPETFLSTEGSTLFRATNEAILATGKRPDKDVYILTALAGLTNVTALRLVVLADDALPKRGPGRQDNGNLHLSEIEVHVFAPRQTNSSPVKIRRATADFNQAGWGIERAIDGDSKTAWGIFPKVGQSHQAVFEFAEPLRLAPASRLSVILRQAHGDGHLIGAFNLAVTGDDPSRVAPRPLELDEALAVATGDRSLTQRVTIAAHALRAQAESSLGRLPRPSVVYAAASAVDILSGDPPRQAKSLAEPKKVHILHRGDFDKPRDVAQPGALSALGHLPARFALKDPARESERRAALADWLAHSNNVLTWRSVVNRVWHYHFGRGLCDTPSDFGQMGGTPSHPELLDWLAVWFRDDAAGSLKALHRLIVTSSTYRQASQHREDAAAIDGDNRWLWRQNRLRLDADSFRDFTLATSGALDLTMGGPAIQHFKQSKGPQNTPALDYTGYDWNQPGAARRSIYRYVWRGIADPFMESLDFPDLGLLAPTRGFSVSSLQSLTLFNNDFVLHHSEVLARRVQHEAPILERQVARAIALAWLRPAEPRELVTLTAFAQAQGLPALGRALLNSNEFLFVD
jgi:mono/diheme cytochrome c family protein